VFILVIGLSIEEPSINRTTAKAWVSLYRKLEIISNLGGVIIHTRTSNGKIQLAVFTPFNILANYIFPLK
jgi:hypothetical protein